MWETFQRAKQSKKKWIKLIIIKEQVSENGVERILILPLIFVAKGPRSYKDNTALTYHNDHITNCIPQIKKIYFKKKYWKTQPTLLKHLLKRADFRWKSGLFDNRCFCIFCFCSKTCFLMRTDWFLFLQTFFFSIQQMSFLRQKIFRMSKHQFSFESKNSQGLSLGTKMMKWK